MRLTSQQIDQRLPPPGPLVLRRALLKNPTRVEDRVRPVSRRSEPSSRAVLMGEQTNPWDLLQPQDTTSRHRGAEPRRRCGRSGATSLLSPGQLLSDKPVPFHKGIRDHQDRLSSLLDPSISQLSWLIALPIQYDVHPYQANLCTPALLLRRKPPQSNCPPDTVPECVFSTLR